MAELAKAWLYQQARVAALVLAARSGAELDAAAGLPKQDVSMQLPLPGLLSPALERLRAAITNDDPDYVEGPMRVRPPDPFNLDRDGDGWGCEDR